MFELAFYDIAVQHVRHYGFSPELFNNYVFYIDFSSSENLREKFTFLSSFSFLIPLQLRSFYRIEPGSFGIYDSFCHLFLSNEESSDDFVFTRTRMNLLGMR